MCHSCRSRTLYPAELRSHVIFGVPAGGNLYSIPNPAGKCKCFLCRRQNFFAGHFQKHLPCRVSPGARGEESAPPGNPAAGEKPPGGLQAAPTANPCISPRLERWRGEQVLQRGQTPALRNAREWGTVQRGAGLHGNVAIKMRRSGRPIGRPYGQTMHPATARNAGAAGYLPGGQIIIIHHGPARNTGAAGHGQQSRNIGFPDCFVWSFFGSFFAKKEQDSKERTRRPRKNRAPPRRCTNFQLLVYYGSEPFYRL